jgi:enoyl-CoA hydratase/carnithine racemase
MTTVMRGISDGVGWITLNRPDRLNAITVELGRELERAILDVGTDQDVNVVIIRGAGGNFCAGGDFDEVTRLQSAGSAALRSLFDTFRQACEAIGKVKVPVVAAVEGVAMAGGFELMQAADIVLVSDEARIADNHINFGMIPGGGSTQRLPRLVGRQIALGMLLSGDRMSGLDAVRRGLAYRSFPQAEFDDEVQRFVTALARRQQSAVSAIKQLVYSSVEHTSAAGLDDEITAVVAHIGGKDGARGVAAFGAREVGR